MNSVVTDSTNASRTMLMGIKDLDWNQENLDVFSINEGWLPKIVKNSSDDFGSVHKDVCPELSDVPITGVLGDQQAACFGHLLKPGEVKTTYGTGCFILTNVGEKPVISNHGLLSTVCYRLDGKTQYALEGAVETAGAAIKWAKSVDLVKDERLISEEALTVDDCGDVYFVPSFGGLLSPHYSTDARSLLIGMSFNTTRGHLMRALLEGPCLRTAEVVQAMSQDAGRPINAMAVDGGMTVNDLMMQT